MDSLLEEINHQLSEQGLHIKSGEVSIDYAIVIEAKQNRSNKRKDGSSTQYPEAAWNVKKASYGQRKSTYGFKPPINVNEDSFIKTTDYSKGRLHDSHCFTELPSGNESVVYTDSAYRSKKHTDSLAKRGIQSRVIKRICRGRALKAEDMLEIFELLIWHSSKALFFVLNKQFSLDI